VARSARGAAIGRQIVEVDQKREDAIPEPMPHRRAPGVHDGAAMERRAHGLGRGARAQRGTGGSAGKTTEIRADELFGRNVMLL
jgi:hypothetical protein